jgi:hypothetical protein
MLANDTIQFNAISDQLGVLSDTSMDVAVAVAQLVAHGHNCKGKL